MQKMRDLYAYDGELMKSKKTLERQEKPLEQREKKLECGA
jgi:hypothetical protein